MARLVWCFCASFLFFNITWGADPDDKKKVMSREELLTQYQDLQKDCGDIMSKYTKVQLFLYMASQMKNAPSEAEDGDESTNNKNSNPFGLSDKELKKLKDSDPSCCIF